ncbi:MAG: hypothetical protein LBT47_12065 [Deltaproteobacteria bacterium]|jgi:hypothetical protein|nr:hypothetical protein [Deltaproteobacteria bacterium]
MEYTAILIFKGLAAAGRRFLGPLAAKLAAGFLGLSLMWAGTALGECQQTAATSQAVMRETVQRYQINDPFPPAQEVSSAWAGCLQALSNYVLVIGPDLGPLPDFGEVTEKICRKLRQEILDKVTPAIPSPGVVTGTNKAVINQRLSRELAETLR